MTGGAPEEAARRPTRGWLRHLNIVALLVVIAATAALLLQPSDDDSLLGLPQLAVGERAPRTIKAPRDFAVADPETTERLRLDAVAKVLPVYDLSTGLGVEVKNRIERAYAEMTGTIPQETPEAAAAKRPPEPRTFRPEDRELADNFMRALQLYFEDHELEVLFRGGFGEQIRDAAIMVARTVFEQHIVEDKDFVRLQAPQGITLRVLGRTGELEHEQTLHQLRNLLGLDQARASVDEIVAKKLDHLSPVERRSVALVVKRLLRPNVVANTAETQARWARERTAVRTVVIPIKRGETVLPAGEIVTARHLLIVEGIAQELEAESRYQLPIGSALVVVLLVILAYRFQRQGRRRFLGSHRDLAFAATVYVVTIVLSWLSYEAAGSLAEHFPSVGVGPFARLAPVAFGPLLLRFVSGREVAAAFTPLAALTVGLMMDNSLHYAVYALAGGLGAASVVDAERPRWRIFFAGLVAASAQILAVVALSLLESRFSVDSASMELLGAIGSGVGSALLVFAVVPAVEVLFGYTSPAKLQELANLNHPLLRDLLVQAPGTYHHSIVVGALAEAGARAVGADPLLARVGGYYHDVGKLKNPRSFWENTTRRAGEEISPRRTISSFGQAASISEEAREIKLHVGDGLEIGAHHRLGQPILEIIAQHHGTKTIRRLEKKLAEGGASIPPMPAGALEYPGPRPLTAEAGLVMLADGVEAATEALLAATPIEGGMLEATVQRVVFEAIAGGQLDHCPLTLQDLNVVAAEFVVVLRDILSRRGRPAQQISDLPQAPLLRQPPLDDDRPN